jgi:uncharacterized protein YwgA
MFKRLKNFDVTTSHGRIVIQKIGYFLQEFGLNFNYSFSWFLHGPYSTRLMADAFELDKMWDTTQERQLDDDEEKALEKLLVFLGDRKEDYVWLELLGSIHFVKKIAPTVDKGEIIRRVLLHQEYFTEEMCSEAWNYLEKFNRRENRFQ